MATRQAVVDLVRIATLGSYGVTGFAGPMRGRILAALGLTQPGIHVHLGAVVDVELDLVVAPGVPIAEVARQVDSAVRYTLQQGLGRDVRRLIIHINGLRAGSGGEPADIGRVPRTGVGPDDLADSGMDVA
jgi:uncharacterized alkaline shock family protein YloU